MTQTDQQNVPKLRFPEFEGDWEATTLGKHVDLLTGYPFKSAEYSEDEQDVRLLRGDNVIQGRTRWEDARRWPSQKTTDLSRYWLEKGDIVIALDRTWVKAGIKAAKITSEDLPCLLVQRVARMRGTGTLDAGIVGAFIESHKFVEMVKSSKTETAVPHISPKDIREFKVTLPTLPEQRKIAGFLGAVDAKIAQLAEKMRLLEDYKKGCMQQLFSQKIRFKDDTGNDFPDWEDKRLGEVADIKRGASPRPISSPTWFDDASEIGWVRISDVTASGRVLTTTTQKLSSAGVKKSRLVPPGRMIMSICATIGKPVYTGFPVCIHDGFVVFDKLKMYDQFLFYFLERIEKRWYRYGQPGTQVNLNSDIVAQETVPLPHPDEQRKIADFLSALDHKIDLAGQELDHARSFKQGLLQQMFV